MSKEDGMTPEEKWKRITNPETLSDYGLSITEQELQTFDEGRAVIAGIQAERQKNALMRAFGERAGNTIEHVTSKVLSKTSTRKKG